MSTLIRYLGFMGRFACLLLFFFFFLVFVCVFLTA